MVTIAEIIMALMVGEAIFIGLVWLISLFRSH